MKVEVFHSRDPDHSCEMVVLVDGRVVEFDQASLDAGAGWVWSEWLEQWSEAAATASPKMADLIRAEAISQAREVQGAPSEEECAQEFDAAVEAARR